MKKIILLVFIFGLCLQNRLVFSQSTTPSQKEDLEKLKHLGHNGQIDLQFPADFRAKTLDDWVMTKKDLPEDRPLLLIYFRPDCSSCQEEGKMLSRNLSHYPDMPIWLVTAQGGDTVKSYLYHTGLFPARRLTVVFDHDRLMHRWYDFAYVPLILLFDKKHQLIKEFDQLPSPAELKAFLEERGQL